MEAFPVRRPTRGPRALLLALLLALALVATACGENATDAPEEPGGAAGGTGDGEAERTEAAAPGDAGPIHFGWIAWDENIANTFLWKEILEQEGYEVAETQLDAAPVYTGLADGTLDVFADAWLPLTHADYWDSYGDQLEDLGVWHEPGVLTIAVPEDAEVRSLDELADHRDTYDGRIVGIEPGAGLTRITREEVMPGYGLDDWELLESSTPAMLTELERAIAADEPIVVTLWRPHWAYAELPIRDLEDPDQLLGEPEELHVLARDGFSDDHPQVAEWLTNFEMDDQQLGSLSALINELGDGREQEAARQWIEQNADLVDGWLGR